MNWVTICRAKCHTEVISSSSSKTNTRTRNAIIITELPYMTNKATLLEKVADLVNDKKLEGIADLRDESDRFYIVLVIIVASLIFFIGWVEMVFEWLWS